MVFDIDSLSLTLSIYQRFMNCFKCVLLYFGCFTAHVNVRITEKIAKLLYGREIGRKWASGSLGGQVRKIKGRKRASETGSSGRIHCWKKQVRNRGQTALEQPVLSKYYFSQK